MQAVLKLFRTVLISKKRWIFRKTVYIITPNSLCNLQIDVFSVWVTFVKPEKNHLGSPADFGKRTSPIPPPPQGLHPLPTQSVPLCTILKLPFLDQNRVIIVLRESSKNQISQPKKGRQNFRKISENPPSWKTYLPLRQLERHLSQVEYPLTRSHVITHTGIS